MSHLNPARQSKPTLAYALAAFSIGLGAAEVATPKSIANASGVWPTPQTQRMIRVLGLRELAHGAALITSPRWAWTRTVGDVLDVAALGLGHRRSSSSAGRGIGAAAALAVVGALDIVAARRYASSG